MKFIIPKEGEIREYAKYAARVREIVQEEIDRAYGRIDPYLLSEVARSATMPIGIWMNNRSDDSVEGKWRMLSAVELKQKLDLLSLKFDLIESKDYLKPKRNLTNVEFQSLKDEMSQIGYHYESGRGFTKA